MHIPRSLPQGLAGFLLASLLATTVEAGENRWTPIGLGSGFVSSLAVAQDGTVYAAAGAAGLYRSTDGARTWQWRGATAEEIDRWIAVVIAPDDPQRLYAATVPFMVNSGGIYTSGDGGLHWQELFRIQAGFTSVAASSDGTLLAATSDSQVHRSVDGGATWSLVLATERQIDPPLRVAFDPLAPELALAGGRTGLWRSTDGGATWNRIRRLPDGSRMSRVSAIAFPGTRPGLVYVLTNSRLFRSEDGGLTWSGGAPMFRGYSALAVDPSDPETVYGVGATIWVSHDGGETAAEISEPLGVSSISLLAIAASTVSPRRLYLAIDGLGVAVSSDAGEHWVLGQQRGLSAGPPSPTDFYAAPSGRLYHEVRGNGVYYRSLDRGASWSRLASIPGGFAFDLIEEAGAPDRLWAANGNRLFRSTDGGASWRSVSSPSSVMNLASPSPGVVLAGGCGIQRSADGGLTWTVSLSCEIGDGGGRTIRRVWRLGTPHGWPGAVWAEIRSGDGTGPVEDLTLFSRDSGLTWRILARGINPVPEIHNVAASRGVIYLNRGTALRRSSDGGATWTSHSVGGRALSVAVDAVDPDIVYIATLHRGVLRSTDGGATWRPLNAGLARLGRLAVQDVQTDPRFPFTAYAFPIKGGIFQGRFE